MQKELFRVPNHMDEIRVPIPMRFDQNWKRWFRKCRAKWSKKHDRSTEYIKNITDPIGTNK